jgi:hypothetical protein
MNERNRWAWAAGCLLAVLGALLAAVAVLIFARPQDRIAPAATPILPAAAAVVAAPTDLPQPGEARPGDGKAIPTPAPFETTVESPDQRSIRPEAAGDLARLYDTLLPVQDYFETAEELGRLELGDRLASHPPAQVGDRRTFSTADGSREAALVVSSGQVMVWVEVGLPLDQAALGAAVERLERDYLPRLRDIFGSEWSPGVDGDPRISILHTLGSPDVAELGYFTDENQYPRSLYADSNEQEMVYLNMSRLQVGDELYFGTLVHEIQHLIQWNLDANEDVWLNEGLSQLAEEMLGLDTVAVRPYQERPSVRLDRWHDDPPDVYAHYAASYLFVQYVREQAGDAAVRELARHPANGLGAVRAVLAGYQPDRTLESFAGDWAVATYLDDPAAGAIFDFRADELGPRFLSDRVRQLPAVRDGAPEQWTAEAVDLDLSGPVVIRFRGDSAGALLPPPPGDGRVWFGPAANSSRAQLTAVADLAGIKAPVLAFDAWYDLEPDWDYAYLSASADGGATWDVLPVESGVSGNFGPAFGGWSADRLGQQDGWVRYRVPLGAYEGKTILLRFDLVTDFEGLGQGFAVANAGIGQTTGDGLSWQPAGFVQTGAQLPQPWEVRIVIDGEQPQVVTLALDELNRGEARVDLGPEGGAVIVMPVNPFVDGTAAYRLDVIAGN